MSRDNRLKTTVSDEVAADVARIAEAEEKSVAEVVRRAIREYTDHDRVARIEDRLDRIEGALADVGAAVDADDTHTHEPCDRERGSVTGLHKTTNATEKARVIVRERIQPSISNPDGVIAGGDVRRAIEDYAGSDPRTVRKYERLFRERGYLWEHPGDRELWTTDREMWLSWLRQFVQVNGRSSAEAAAEPYPINLLLGADEDGSPELHIDTGEGATGGRLDE